MKFIKTTENGIKYLVHPKESVFAGMKIRENPQDAFDNAIKKGMKNLDDWMYMYSENGKDYFKHYDTSVNGKIKCRNSVKNFVGFPTFFIC